jgi:23S rRNA pseudouridine2605 synthase
LNDDTSDPSARSERIAKALAHIGVASRREAERLIEAGRISVNGKVLDSPAFKVGPGDEIALDGQPVGERPPTRLWRYHKPAGLLTTHKDPEGRETVFDALPDDMGRVISVGRLDLNSEGLLLITNDGELARVLELPATGWTRRYRVRAYGNADDKALASLKDGVTVEGVVYGPMEVVVDRRTGANVWLTVGLKEGKNREVRKVLAHVGLSVNRLMRIAYGPFQLGALKKGEAEEVRPAVLREQLGRLYPLDAKNHPTSEVAAAPSGRAKARPKPARPGGKGAGWAKASKMDEPGHKARKRAEKTERAQKGELTSAKGSRRPSSKSGAKPGPKNGGARDAHRRGRS